MRRSWTGALVAGLTASPLAAQTHTIDANSIHRVRPQPTPEIRALVVADTLRGTIDGTGSPIPPKILESFHSVFLAATCGTRLH